MRNKVSVVFLCALLVVSVLSTSVFARDDHRTYFKLNRAPKYMIPFERPTGTEMLGPKNDANLALLGMIPTTSPGVQAGLTTYDYQHNGAMGRQIECFPGTDYVHFVWMAQDNYVIPGDRGIKYQCYDAASDDYTQIAGGKPATTDYSGYTSAAALPDGRGIFGCHSDIDGNAIYVSTAYFDYAAGIGIFSNESGRPNTGAPWYCDGMETIWPIMARHNAGGGVTSDVLYMLSHDNGCSEDLILYRKVGTGAFDNGTYIETVTDLAYTIAADPYSNKVYVVYTDDRMGMDEGDGGQTNLDVWYKMSNDQGVNWNAPVNISNYSGDSLWRAYSDLSAVIDPDGHLHVIWPARQLNDSTSYENAKSRLVHWSTAYPHARIISEARYDMAEGCDPGAWNMYIAKPSVSWCDSRIYALWTQFGHGREAGGLYDCSQAGYANGELYLAVSNDDGFTWDLPQNLTQSRTPNCDSVECDSDHWSSMTSYGMVYDAAMDTLDIQYINDKDAGGIPQGEGAWCVNPVMHLRIPCRDIIPTPQVSLVPNRFTDPTVTAPGVEKDTTLTVINIGNATLTGSFSISYVNGDGWLSIGGAQTAPVSVPSGSSNTADFTIGLNEGGTITTAPTGWDAYILLTSNAPTSPDTIVVHLTVGSINMPEQAILNTTCKTLKVWNTGRSGDHDGDHSMIIPGDCDTTTTYPDQRYLYDGSPMLSWKNGTVKIGYTSVFDQLFTEDETWRPQSGLTTTTQTGYTKTTYTVSSADSLFACDVEIYTPTDGSKCYFVQRLKYRLWGSTTAKDDVYLGYFMDWDTPSDSNVDNNSGYAATPYPSIWQVGAEYVDDNLPCDIDEDNRRGGLALFGTTNASDDFYGAWTKVNADNQSGTGFVSGFLYDNMSVTGVNLYTSTTDPEIDLHTGVTFDMVDMVPGKTYDYVFALITTNTGETDFNNQITSAQQWADDLGLLGCCDVAGDANNDGKVNVGDAVYIITYVFRGGPAPICMQEGDANGDGKVNVGDAVYIITFVFRGGPAPICGP